MTTKKDKARPPERLIVCTDGHKATIADWPKDKMEECDVEYIRAVLLATKIAEARREAFKDAADYIRRQWLAAYPVEVFPEPPKPPAQCSRDVISAAMGRHMATRLIEHFEAAAKGEE